MKTFDYESKCVRYRDCFFDKSLYSSGKTSLAIYGKVEDSEENSHISNATVDVKEKLPRDQIVINNYENTNLISFLMDLGIAKRVIKRVAVNGMALPVVEVNLDLLDDYCYFEEELKYAS